MKRKKTEDTTHSAKFWPVPGVDGEPYPPLVQEALDLVEKETRRRKIRECKHEGRYPTQVNPGWEGLHSRPYHVCACRDCGAKGPGEISCLRPRDCDPEVRLVHRKTVRHTPVYGFAYERPEDRLRKSITTVTPEELDWERVKARNRARQATRTHLPSVISDPDDMSWIKTTNKV